MKIRSAREDFSGIIFKPRVLDNIPESKSTLFVSCALVAKEMNFSLVTPTQLQPSIEQICEASKIRFRNITLVPNWWKKRDLGPFVAFLKENHAPVCCLLDKSLGYRIIDPSSGDITPLTEESASLLEDEAMMLYPPLAAKPEKWRTLLASLFRGNAWEFRYFIFASILAIVMGFLFPIGNKVLFDYVIPAYNYTVYTQLFLALFVALISSTIFSFSRSVLLLRFNGIFSSRLQIGFWDRVLQLAPHFFQTIARGDLLQRSMIFDQLRSTVGMSILASIATGIFSMLYLVMMFIYSLPLTLIGLALVFLWLVFSACIMVIKIYYSRLHLISTGKIDAFLVQALNAINKIRATALEGVIFSKWSKEFTYNQALSLKILNLQNILRATQSFMNVLFPLALYIYVIYVASEKKGEQTLITPGTFLAFTAAFSPFVLSLMKMVATLLSVVELVPFWQRVRPILQAPLEKTESKIDPGALDGKISVNNLSFRYGTEGALILKDINFSIEPRQFIGLVGKSGCGKSTLCRLLFGFDKPESGSIFYDNQNLTILDIEKLRKQIGFVFHNNKIFTANVFDNLTCGGKFSAALIEEIIQLTTLNEDLKDLPMGLDTILSATGGILSGGQKQKILLGRALLSKPKILILDEGLNTLDNRTQATVLENLKKLNITLLLVSHSLNILQTADTIFVMEEGKMTTSGTFQTLSTQPGIFSKFYQEQKL